MRIGIISNSDAFIPLAITLSENKIIPLIYYTAFKEEWVNQKVNAFIKHTKLPCTIEKNVQKDLYKWLTENNFDACFVLGYPRLIDIAKLKQLRTQIFNIHFGPLPAFKGPVPVFWQLKYSSGNIGLSIHQLSARFDDGALVWTKQLPDQPHYNYHIVQQLFSQVCVEGVLHILRFILSDMTVPLLQKNTVTSYQKRPILKDVLINWKEMPATEICNLIRACNPWNKGAATFLNNQELKLMDACIVNKDVVINATPGTIIHDENCIHIFCADHSTINVNMIYYNESFIPAYQAKLYGLNNGKQLGEFS